jgi:hypothetical protein
MRREGGRLRAASWKDSAGYSTGSTRITELREQPFASATLLHAAVDEDRYRPAIGTLRRIRQRRKASQHIRRREQGGSGHYRQNYDFVWGWDTKASAFHGDTPSKEGWESGEVLARLRA